MSFQLQPEGNPYNRAIQLSVYIVSICSLICCAAPCFLCSLFQVLVSYGLFSKFRKKKKKN